MASLKTTNPLTGEDIKVTFDKLSDSQPTFTKAQLVSANRYDTKRDALHVVLRDGQTYTHEQAETLLKEFYKGGKK